MQVSHTDRAEKAGFITLKGAAGGSGVARESIVVLSATLVLRFPAPAAPDVAKY